MSKIGITFVRKANMWLYHEHHNVHSHPDFMQWFNTEEEAIKFQKERGEEYERP